MQKVTFKNIWGEVVEIGYNFPFFLSRIEGLGDVQADIQSQKSPNQNGSSYIDSTLQKRTISIEISIMKDFHNARQILSRIFNPSLGEGLLVYENDFGKWQIKAVSEHVPIFPDNRPRIFQVALIDLIAHNPYWEDETDNKKSLIAYRNGLRYPFSFPKSYGIEGHSVVIVNEGHVDAPITIEFFGPSLNPTLTNETTGEFIKVYRQLRRGEKLTLNTDFNRKRVEITRKDGTVQNAYGYVDWFESSFIKLIPGINVLKYTADSGTEEAVVNIIYRNRYVGI